MNGGGRRGNFFPLLTLPFSHLARKRVYRLRREKKASLTQDQRMRTGQHKSIFLSSNEACFHLYRVWCEENPSWKWRRNSHWTLKLAARCKNAWPSDKGIRTVCISSVKFEKKTLNLRGRNYILLSDERVEF